MSSAFGARLCGDGVCASGESTLDGGEGTAADSEGEGGGLGREMVYLIVILVCGMMGFG